MVERERERDWSFRDKSGVCLLCLLIVDHEADKLLLEFYYYFYSPSNIFFGGPWSADTMIENMNVINDVDSNTIE